jgi:hypothetical protein
MISAFPQAYGRILANFSVIALSPVQQLLHSAHVAAENVVLRRLRMLPRVARGRTTPTLPSHGTQVPVHDMKIHRYARLQTQQLLGPGNDLVVAGQHRGSGVGVVSCRPQHPGNRRARWASSTGGTGTHNTDSHGHKHSPVHPGPHARHTPRANTHAHTSFLTHTQCTHMHRTFSLPLR